MNPFVKAVQEPKSSDGIKAYHDLGDFKKAEPSLAESIRDAVFAQGGLDATEIDSPSISSRKPRPC